MTNLRKLRKARGLKQKELAKKAGVSATLVNNQELSGIQTIRVARRYAAVLGCDPLELLG